MQSLGQKRPRFKCLELESQLIKRTALDLRILKTKTHTHAHALTHKKKKTEKEKSKKSRCTKYRCVLNLRPTLAYKENLHKVLLVLCVNWGYHCMQPIFVLKRLLHNSFLTTLPLKKNGRELYKADFRRMQGL